MATWHPGCVPPGTFMTYLLTVRYLAPMMHYVQTTHRKVKEYSHGSHLIILHVFTWWLAASDTSIYRRDFENQRKASHQNTLCHD